MRAPPRRAARWGDGPRAGADASGWTWARLLGAGGHRARPRGGGASRRSLARGVQRRAALPAAVRRVWQHPPALAEPRGVAVDHGLAPGDGVRRGLGEIAELV